VRLDALTGLSDGQRAELLRRVVALLGTTVIARPGGRPNALCLAGSVDLVCVLLRTNITQEQAACLFEVSRATASRRWDLLRGVIATALATLVPTARRIVGNAGTVPGDGFPAPRWDWKDAVDTFPGKHDEAGFNIQAGAALSGDLAAVRGPVPKARHDGHALAASGPEAKLAGHDTLADKGYQGHATFHPIKKPREGDLSIHDKRHNGSLSPIRPAVERANAHLKNRKILATPYRAPLDKFAETLQAVVGLHFLR
jgi:DDE superfamily endonuclease/Helix-turn-helix of DDE superfamily endonuclease